MDAIDVLLRSRAFPEPTFVWWDVRLQPKLGTIEVRIVDAQTRAEDNAALAALVQSVVRLETTEGHVPATLAAHPEVLDENRFLASRDGMRANFIDPDAISASGCSQAPAGTIPSAPRSERSSAHSPQTSPWAPAGR